MIGKTLGLLPDHQSIGHRGAKGISAGERADIWAFGCILYEWQTGKSALKREKATNTLAVILKGEPDCGVPAE